MSVSGGKADVNQASWSRQFLNPNQTFLLLRACSVSILLLRDELFGGLRRRVDVKLVAMNEHERHRPSISSIMSRARAGRGAELQPLLNSSVKS
jgi:hypothetical protein